MLSRTLQHIFRAVHRPEMSRPLVNRNGNYSPIFVEGSVFFHLSLLLRASSRVNIRFRQGKVTTSSIRGGTRRTFVFFSMTRSIHRHFGYFLSRLHFHDVKRDHFHSNFPSILGFLSRHVSVFLRWVVLIFVIRVGDSPVRFYAFHGFPRDRFFSKFFFRRYCRHVRGVFLYDWGAFIFELFVEVRC